jgi:ParB family chromosome partitioning protein
VIASDQKQGYFEIVSGERRHKAARIAGLEKVPCIIITDQKTADEISIIENIQREDLHPIELKNAYKNLITLGICKSYQDVADKVCASKSSVADILALDKLPEQTQDTLLNKKIKSREVFRTLFKLPAVDHQKVIEQYVSKKRNNINNIVRISKPRSLSRKAKVLSIAIFGDELLIEKNKISKLSPEHKQKLKELINTLM